MVDLDEHRDFIDGQLPVLLLLGGIADDGAFLFADFVHYPGEVLTVGSRKRKGHVVQCSPYCSRT